MNYFISSMAQLIFYIIEYYFIKLFVLKNDDTLKNIFYISIFWYFGLIFKVLFIVGFSIYVEIGYQLAFLIILLLLNQKYRIQVFLTWSLVLGGYLFCAYFMDFFFVRFDCLDPGSVNNPTIFTGLKSIVFYNISIWMIYFSIKKFKKNECYCVVVLSMVSLIVTLLLIENIGLMYFDSLMIIVTLSFILNIIMIVTLLNYVVNNDSTNDIKAIVDENLNEKLKFNHDLEGHLTTVETLVSIGKKEEALQYLKDIYEIKENSYMKSYTCNLIINAFLNTIAKELTDKNIEYEFIVDYSSNKILNFDLVKILSNLIRNAQEAINNREGKITLKLIDSFGMVLIEVSNPYYSELKNINECLFTTTKKNHNGFGLLIVNETVKKYSGFIKVNTENSMFEVQIGI